MLITQQALEAEAQCHSVVTRGHRR